MRTEPFTDEEQILVDDFLRLAGYWSAQPEGALPLALNDRAWSLQTAGLDPTRYRRALKALMSARGNSQYTRAMYTAMILMERGQR
jgi:hypothetical protein